MCSPRAADTEGRPRRNEARSTISSWMRVATCNISSDAAARRTRSGRGSLSGIPRAARADSSRTIGRKRLPAR
jgi:hypothetical protein